MNQLSCILVICCSMSLVISESPWYLEVPSDCSELNAEDLMSNFLELCNGTFLSETDVTPMYIKNGSCSDMMDKLQTVKNYSMAFETLLSKTVEDVSLRKGDRAQCMTAYNTWLCATQFTFYNNNDSMGNRTKCKPTIGVCNMVVQNCPYYSPARHQMVKGCKREVIHGGLPAFMCPKKGNEYKFVNNGTLDCNDT